MGILRRAVRFLDQAQDQVSSVTTQASHLVSAAARVRTQEARQVDLRQQLKHATMDLGKLSFQRWKSGGTGNEQAIDALCRRIDALNAEYQQLLADLNISRAAGPAPLSLPADPLSSPLPPPLAHYVPVLTAPPVSPVPVMAKPQPQATLPLPSPPLIAVSPPPPPRPAPLPARECPECYARVPGASEFCPSCGMRV